MGSRSNNDDGGGGVGIPEGSRKIIRSLKEVVGSTEAEIYAMLKDCNMDPNEAVNRLLSQDPFHEVKSKREKKKENKNMTEPKSRSSRGGKGSSDHYVGRSGTQYSSSDTGSLHGKPAYNKKENGSNAYASHSSVSSGTTGSNAYHRPPAHSDYAKIENKVSITDTSDGGWSSSKPSSGNQPVWGGVPGQISMADIVKMGRSPGKPSRSTPNHDLNNSKVSLDNNNNNEWLSFEPSTRISPVVQPASDWDTNETQFSSNTITQHTEPEQEEVPAVEDEYVENISGNHEGYDSVSDWRIRNNNNSEGASHFNSDVYENMEGYQPQENVVEYREVEDIGVTVSSVTSTLQQLNLINDREAQPEKNVDAVIIPDHLQVQTEDCLHLSFGSFGSLSAGPASSLPFSSRPTNNNKIEEDGADIDAPSVGHLETRNSEYYGDESLRTASDGNLVHRTGASGATEYDSQSISQSEVLNQENHGGGTHENQYAFPPSHNYSFENAGQLNASFPPSQTSVQMQTSSDGYAYTLPSSFLAANAQLKREADYSYSPFAMGQSMPAKYGNSVPSVSTTVSMPEVLKAAGLSSTQQTPQNQPGSNIATGPALPQQLLHQYAQMGQFPNLMGYPFLPQNYYLPGAYQQAAYHQSLNAQQYKNSVSVSSLPQSAAVASGYGGNFGSPTGNFSANQPSAQGTGTVGYEDVLSSQYKEASHLLSLQQAQNENQAMWLQGHGSRTISGIPANTYYSYLGQNQQQQTPAGYRQNQQQPSQNYGSHGNSNFYNSQSGILLEHKHQQQQQNPRDGSQIQANKHQSQQLWQNSY